MITMDTYSKFLRRFQVLEKLHWPANSEVYTPRSLVCDIYNNHDIDFWKTPHIVVDPCIKSGVFLGEAVIRFMSGLDHMYADDLDARFRYIRENLVRGICVSTIARDITVYLLYGDVKVETESIYTVNHVDFKTDSDMMNRVKEILDNMNADLIVGNPPFQEIDKKTGRPKGGGQGGGNNLWSKFVEVSVDNLKPDGYLAMIMPTGWMTPSSDLAKSVMFKYRVHHLEIGEHLEEKFPVGSQFCWIILQKTASNAKTSIHSQWNGLSGQYHGQLGEFGYVPRFVSDESMSILRKFRGTSETFSFTLDTEMHLQAEKKKKRASCLRMNKSKKFCYPIRHTTAQEAMWSNRAHKVQSKKKVIVSDSGYLGPMYDNGVHGVTQHSLYCLVSSDSEGEFMVKLMKSRLFRFIFSICYWSGFTNPLILTLLPYPKGLPTSFTDADLYKHFKLTDAEIKTIEDTIKD